ncbi:MAG: hypothetical protein NC826_00490 [Candidatus Omnitrophica bacterium]|nr:hypothetical protein [Candidatus Omnitrophota bacterium]
MFKRRTSNKSVALVYVLGVLVAMMAIASLIITIFLSQFRLSHHHTSRMQAYYAAMAGINYAFEKVRTGQIGPTQAYNYTLHDEDFPVTVRNKNVYIEVAPYNTTRQQRRIKVRVNYLN